MPNETEFQDDLQCAVNSVMLDFRQQTAMIDVPFQNVADMEGSIRFVQRMMPDVIGVSILSPRSEATKNESFPDIEYEYEYGGKWVVVWDRRLNATKEKE